MSEVNKNIKEVHELIKGFGQSKMDFDDNGNRYIAYKYYTRPVRMDLDASAWLYYDKENKEYHIAHYGWINKRFKDFNGVKEYVLEDFKEFLSKQQ